jgi:protein-tyrosine kinase
VELLTVGAKALPDSERSYMNASQQLSPNRSIGAILIGAGVLSAEDAERVMTLQREQGLRFGDAAVRLGILSEDDIRFALSHQFNYSYLSQAGERSVSTELVAAYQPFCYEVEQLRAIRTELLLRWFSRDSRRNALTLVSPDRSEGRSYVAANLAIAFSQLGERTLLVDADLRAPRQHELFRLENKIGFSSVLAGRAEVGTSIVRVPYFVDLSILPAGPIPPNPQELLNRPAFGKLLEMARESFDVVLIDTSSTSWGADANLIAARSGAALAIARTSATKLSAFGDLVKALTRVGVTVVGSVLNDPPLFGTPG